MVVEGNGGRGANRRSRKQKPAAERICGEGGGYMRSGREIALGEIIKEMEDRVARHQADK